VLAAPPPAVVLILTDRDERLAACAARPRLQRLPPPGRIQAVTLTFPVLPVREREAVAAPPSSAVRGGTVLGERVKRLSLAALGTALLRQIRRRVSHSLMASAASDSGVRASKPQPTGTETEGSTTAPTRLAKRWRIYGKTAGTLRPGTRVAQDYEGRSDARQPSVCAQPLRGLASWGGAAGVWTNVRYPDRLGAPPCGGH
jgi:hypothetical protein